MHCLYRQLKTMLGQVKPISPIIWLIKDSIFPMYISFLCVFPVTIFKFPNLIFSPVYSCTLMFPFLLYISPILSFPSVHLHSHVLCFSNICFPIWTMNIIFSPVYTCTRMFPFLLCLYVFPILSFPQCTLALSSFSCFPFSPLTHFYSLPSIRGWWW